MTPDQYLDKFTKQHPKLIDLGLERVFDLLDALGNPHHRLPPVVHIAGTNGKGSTLAFLKSLCEAAGLSVHRYTSPHLVRFNERIQLNGADISDKALVAACRKVDETIEKHGISASFFEATTAAAFVAFSENAADILLLETGLGGRLDATNVLSNPALTLISPIDFDHEKFLGSTLADIAGEKAGIFKENVPIISAPQQPEVEAVLRQKAADKKAEITFIGAPVPADWALGLAGDHQAWNAALARAAANKLGLSLSETATQQALCETAWPARFQKLAENFYLDASHNPAGGRALADCLMKLPSKPTTLICGMKQDKNAGAFLKSLAPYVTDMIAIPIPNEDCFAPERLCALAAEAGIPSCTPSTLDIALSLPLSMTMGAALDSPSNPPIGQQKTRRFVISGSLYLAGAVLERLPKLKNAA